MFGDKGFIRISCGVMALGFVGTLAVMNQFLPAPKIAPRDPFASEFASAFVGKDFLERIYQGVRLKVFRTAPASVVIGKHGWLYYRSEASGDGETISDFMGKVTPAPATLAAWKSTLAERRHTLAAQNIRYLLFAAPNTVTIYPENLPREIRAQRGLSRMDAIMATMPEEVLDLRPALLAHRNIEPVFNRSNTHWNDFGAFIAYQTVTTHLRNWFPAIQPLQRGDFRPRPEMRDGEVEIMSGANVLGTPYRTSYLDPVRALPAQCAETGAALLVSAANPEARAVNTPDRNWVWFEQDCPSRTFVQAEPSLPRAVVFHDSFMIALGPFLAQNFRKVLFVRGRFDSAVVAREAPDVVLEEVTERYIDGF